MREARSTDHEPLRPHQVNIQPGTLFSYAMFSLEEGVWKHFEDRWLVVEVVHHGVQSGIGPPDPGPLHPGIGPTHSISAVNQAGRLNRTHLYPTDKIVVHCG